MEELTRAKHRALYILERMDRTEQELREKLLKNYPEEIVDQVIDYVKGYGYIDDQCYAGRYIRMKRETKSRRQIEQELILKKGVSKEVVRAAFDENEMPDPCVLIRRQLEKKHYDPTHTTREEQQKLFASLMRKGFSSSDIKKELFLDMDAF